MSELEFRDPAPPKTGQRGRIGKLLDALREHPGRWAVVGSYAGRGASPAAARINKIPGYEAVARKLDGEPRYELFARYIGPDGEHR